MQVLTKPATMLVAAGLLACAVFVVGAAQTSQEKGGQEEFGPYELVANWPQPLPDGAGRRQARRLDVGIGRRGVRRDARSHLDRAARRAAAAGEREAVDAVRAAAAAAHGDRQHRRPERHL